MRKFHHETHEKGRDVNREDREGARIRNCWAGPRVQAVGSSQRQISRLESPGDEGHSLSMLRRVASALKARVRVVLEPEAELLQGAEDPTPYETKRRAGKTCR